MDLILKYDDKALTALDPTPFKPTDFLKYTYKRCGQIIPLHILIVK